jgi:hypothetical protein
MTLLKRIKTIMCFMKRHHLIFHICSQPTSYWFNLFLFYLIIVSNLCKFYWIDCQ